jgi:hypothetical protein
MTTNKKIAVHALSLATTYIETFAVRRDNGQLVRRSYATGFFVRVPNAILLVTNWHVVTGLNPAEPSHCDKPIPELMKVTVRGREGGILELSLPLYARDLAPMWYEHEDGHAVDIAIYPLRVELANHFEFVDLMSMMDDDDIDIEVAKEVFILGYPFCKTELEESFGQDAPYYLPIWKRGSIASEPGSPYGGRVVLIDSLSRPGMSGSPVVIAQEQSHMVSDSSKTQAIFRRIEQGDLRAYTELDRETTRDATVKSFNFFGVYSGVVGTTRMAEVALGKCWSADTLVEVINAQQPGRMPFHAPVTENEPYAAYFADTTRGTLVMKDVDGAITNKINLS